jgi:Domain of unknown function (DUF3805)
MSYKKFTSPSGWFSLTLPVDWEEYDDDDTDEGTYAFFNAKEWTGNFRITCFRWTNLGDPGEDKSKKYIQEELNENPGATKLKLGDLDCAHYKKDLPQDGDDLLIYYWVLGQKDNLFVCSFTIDKKQEPTTQNKAEINIVQDVIRSISIN